MRPIFNESFVEKKKNCRSREQCMKSTGKVEMCFSKKKKKKMVECWMQTPSKRSLSEDFPLHIIREGGTET